MVTPGNFSIGGGFKGDKVKFYSGPLINDYILKTNDLIVTMTDLSKQADTLGFPALVPSSAVGRYLHNQRIGKIIILDKVLIHDRWIYYLLCDKKYRNEIISSATGTTVKHTSPTRIKRHRFLLPPVSEQYAIAAILGALDDKIELNRRMNETLEAMARAIFKDWFVDFGPTRAKVAGQTPYLAPEIWSLFPDQLDAEGKPEGWGLGKLGDVAISPRAGINPSQIDADTPYIGLEHMPRRCLALSEWESVGNVTSIKSPFCRSDFLFGKLRPYFHKVGVAPIDGVCSTDIVVVRARDDRLRAFTIACLSTDEFVNFADRNSTGTKMPRTSWSAMARYQIVLPPASAAAAFDELCWPFIKSVEANIHESRTLAATRDFLLPKLMSGEIRVKDAERALEDVA